ATDLEIEITARIPCQSEQGIGEITVPSKKLVDIIRSLDDNAQPRIVFKDSTVSIKEGRSHFKLATLPADDYPKMQEEVNEVEFSVSTASFAHVLQATHFAMSQQDVRVFLNSLLIELDTTGLTVVAMDGHRMAVAKLAIAASLPYQRFLLPRKAVQDMLRLLQSIGDESVIVSAGKNHFRIVTQQYVFSSKLVESRFPAYAKAIPRAQNKEVIIDRDILKKTLSRIVILAHEKSRAVLLHLQAGLITLIANNQDKEEAIESLEAETQGEELKIGVNAGYLIDVLTYLPAGLIRLSFSSTDSSILVESLLDEHYQYIIMPMKI
ncbi:MAG: DNA polymerase III subunit beta, partial [Legionellaceae bacterium]